MCRLRSHEFHAANTEAERAEQISAIVSPHEAVCLWLRHVAGSFSAVQDLRALEPESLGSARRARSVSLASSQSGASAREDKIANSAADDRPEKPCENRERQPAKGCTNPQSHERANCRTNQKHNQQARRCHGSPPCVRQTCPTLPSERVYLTRRVVITSEKSLLGIVGEERASAGALMVGARAIVLQSEEGGGGGLEKTRRLISQMSTGLEPFGY